MSGKAAKLAREANIGLEAANAFLSGFQELTPTAMGGQREALRFRKKAGSSRKTIVSQNWQNFMLDWRTALVKTVAAFVGVALAAEKAPIAGILAALQAYRTVVGLFEVEITGDIGKVVELLWLKLSETNAIPLDVVKIRTTEMGVDHDSLDVALKELCALGLIEVKDVGGSLFVVRIDEIVA